MTSITKEDLLRLIDSLPKVEKNINNSFLQFQGIPVFESPHIQDLVPVIKLSDKVTVSDEFRKKCNQYYIDMFGYTEPLIFNTQYGFIIGPNFKNVIITGAIA